MIIHFCPRCFTARHTAGSCDECIQNPKPSQVFKDDSAKLAMHLLPVDPINDIVKTLEFGAKKYSPNAWREGIAWTRIMDAAERHISKWKKGIDNDAESGLNHLAHAACNLLFLLEYARTSTKLDNRFSTLASKAVGHRQLHDVLEGPCLCGATHTNVK